jgi:hypothetical protein
MGCGGGRSKRAGLCERTHCSPLGTMTFQPSSSKCLSTVSPAQALRPSPKAGPIGWVSAGQTHTSGFTSGRWKGQGRTRGLTVRKAALWALTR